MKILDGKKLSEKILKNLKKEIQKKRLKLKLAVVLAGEDEASKLYIKKKREVAKKIGVDFELLEFSEKIKQADLEKKMRELGERKDVSGIVVQLPLPKGLDTERILRMIPKKKDVEGFVSDIDSPVALAIEEFLKEYKLSLKNKKILIVGKGRLVGRSASNWLKRKKIKFEIIDKSVCNLSFFTRKADIIISGTGTPKLIKKDMVKKGVVIMDVGTCRKKGKTAGDVDFENVCQKAKCITPCVGGMGPVTVACLFKSLVCAEGGT